MDIFYVWNVRMYRVCKNCVRKCEKKCEHTCLRSPTLLGASLTKAESNVKHFSVDPNNKC